MHSREAQTVIVRAISSWHETARSTAKQNTAAPTVYGTIFKIENP